MRKSIDKAGFTQIPHIVMDVILPNLSPAAQLVFLRIIRQTIGWQKPFDQISYSQFQWMTGYKDRSAISRALKELKEKNLIICMGEGTAKRGYGVNWETIDAELASLENRPV